MQIWTSWFQYLGVPIPQLLLLARRQDADRSSQRSDQPPPPLVCPCHRHVIDSHGDHIHTCRHPKRSLESRTLESLLVLRLIMALIDKKGPCVVLMYCLSLAYRTCACKFTATFSFSPRVTEFGVCGSLRFSVTMSRQKIGRRMTVTGQRLGP
jgi:hypothetical protein